MKKAHKEIICLLLAVSLFSSFFYVSATMARTSSTMNYYSASLSTAENGKISISASITGRGFCSKIGISHVYIYESSDGGKTFTLYDSYFSSNYPSMMSSGYKYLETPISFTGTIGYQYKATVYCCATYDSENDTKTYKTNIVTARH